MQTPTIGRKVWYWSGPEDLDLVTYLDASQAFDATVIFVHPDCCVNLLVNDHNGTEYVVIKAILEDPEEGDCHCQEGRDEGYASWMPYQKQQHEKATT